MTQEFKASDQYQVVWLIRRLFRAMSQKADSYLQDLGMSAAERATMEFLYPDARLSVPEIAQRYNVSRQHVQVVVNGLLERGLLIELENPRHKRSPLIALHNRGKQMFARILQRDQSAVQQLFSKIAPADSRRVRTILTQMLNNLE